MNETNVSSVSTDWSIQWISIRSDLTIFIDKTIAIIFIDWQLRGIKMYMQKAFCPSEINSRVSDLKANCYNTRTLKTKAKSQDHQMFTNCARQSCDL